MKTRFPHAEFHPAHAVVPATGADTPGVFNAAVVDSAFHHQRWPWRAARGGLVTTRLLKASELRGCGTAHALVQALSTAPVLHSVGGLHLSPALALRLSAPTQLLKRPTGRWNSFSQFGAPAPRP